jgi:hypothetical protein
MQVMPLLEAVLALTPFLGRIVLLAVATGVGLHNNGMAVPMDLFMAWLGNVTSPYTDYLASLAMAWSVMPVVMRWMD